jgi:hypothetical protein
MDQTLYQNAERRLVIPAPFDGKVPIRSFPDFPMARPDASRKRRFYLGFGAPI